MSVCVWLEGRLGGTGTGRKTDLMVSLTRFLRGTGVVVGAVATVMARESGASGVGLSAGSGLVASLGLFGIGCEEVLCADLALRALALRCWRCGGLVTETVVDLDSDCFAAL